MKVKTSIFIREAAAHDAPIIARQWVAMLRTMESVGGHPIAHESLLLSEFENRLGERLGDPAMLYLVAEAEIGVVGMLDASHWELSSVFMPRRVMHVHAVYVDESMRRQGIARRLIERAMQWGREKGCHLAQLNVLVNNPARHLYESMGFKVFDCEMNRPLE